jgi:hypothetical protein
MASELPQCVTEASVFPKSDLAKSWHGSVFSQVDIWPEPTLAPWSKLSWGFFLPLVFAGNVIVIGLAWFLFELVTR